MSTVIEATIEKAVELFKKGIVDCIEYQGQVAYMEPMGIWKTKDDSSWLAAGTSDSAAKGRVFGIPFEAMVKVTLQDFGREIANLASKQAEIDEILENQS